MSHFISNFPFSHFSPSAVFCVFSRNKKLYVTHTLFVLPRWYSLLLMSFSVNYTVTMPWGVAILGLRVFLLEHVSIGAKSSPRKIHLRICRGVGARGMEWKGSGLPQQRGSRPSSRMGDSWCGQGLGQARARYKGQNRGFWWVLELLPHLVKTQMQKTGNCMVKKKVRSDKWKVDKAFVFRRQFVHTYLLETLWHLNIICVGIPRFIILLRYSVFLYVKGFWQFVLSDDGEHF